MCLLMALPIFLLFLSFFHKKKAIFSRSNAFISGKKRHTFASQEKKNAPGKSKQMEQFKHPLPLSCYASNALKGIFKDWSRNTILSTKSSLWIVCVGHFVWSLQRYMILYVWSCMRSGGWNTNTIWNWHTFMRHACTWRKGLMREESSHIHIRLATYKFFLWTFLPPKTKEKSFILEMEKL